MGLETGTYISDLVATNPTATDPKSAGDDHIRLVKAALIASFPGFDGSVVVGGTDTGSANAYTLETVMAAYVANTIVVWKASATNTGGSTININSLGSRVIKTVDGVALSAGDIVSGEYVAMVDDGTDYRLIAHTKNYVDQLAFNTVLPAQAGNPYAVLTTDGTIALWTRNIYPNWQSEEFLASGTFTVPSYATQIVVEAVGPGGGGASGGRSSTASNTGGGGGGGGGAAVFAVCDTPQSLTSTVAVTVGAGGNGGAAVTVDDTFGNNGADGGTSSFGAYVSAVGGKLGEASGASSPGTAGAGGSGSVSVPFVSIYAPSGSAGGAGGYAGAGGDGVNSTLGAGAGGAGGGGAWTATAGGAGGGAVYGAVTTAGGAAGAGGNGPNHGGIGVDGGGNIYRLNTLSLTENTAGSGGGGGGAPDYLSGTTAAGNGGVGGFPGGGGAGGGSSPNGYNSGAGGAGANGRVTVYWR